MPEEEFSLPPEALEQIKDFSNYQEGDPIDISVKDNAIRISTRYIRPFRLSPEAKEFLEKKSDDFG